MYTYKLINGNYIFKYLKYQIRLNLKFIFIQMNIESLLHAMYFNDYTSHWNYLIS